VGLLGLLEHRSAEAPRYRFGAAALMSASAE
jgi:hypothetical protein